MSARVPLAPRTARAIDPAIGERCDGPIFVTSDSHRLDRHGAGRIVRRVARRAGLDKNVGPHTLRHAFITAAQMSRIAFDASFGNSGERALPAAQHAALRRSQGDGARNSIRDLGCQQPVASDACMYHLAGLQKVTECCSQGNVQERNEGRSSIRPIAA